MSPWEFSAQVDGWIEANCPDEVGKLTAGEEDALWEMVQESMGEVI